MTLPRTLLVALACGGTAAWGVACSSLLGLPDPVLRFADGGDGAGDELDVGAPGIPADAAQEACLISSPVSCGTCGHSCLGGACVDASCQPVQVRSGISVPNGLVVDPGDGGSIYWNTFYLGGIFAQDKAIGSPLITLHPQNAIESAAAKLTSAGDGGDLYWSNPVLGTPYGSGIEWISRDGGAPGQVREPADGGWNGPTPIATDGTHVFWGNRWSGEIWRMGMAGDGTTRIDAYDAATFTLTDLAVDDDPTVDGYVFFSDGQNIHRVTKDGTADIVFQSGTGPFLVDNGYLYWFQAGALVREATTIGCPSSSMCPELVLAAGTLKGPGDLATDESYIYIVDNTNDELERVMKNPPFMAQVIATGYTMVDVAVDSVAVYYANQYADTDAASDGGGTGSIWRLAKP
jgi:hypothetical protein